MNSLIVSLWIAAALLGIPAAVPLPIDGEPVVTGFDPRVLAAGDVDGDGVPDLVCGYAANGAGVLTVHPGNAAAIDLRGYSPFLRPAGTLDVPIAPEFLEVGDFDADGDLDIAISERGGSELYLLRGDGSGSFSVPEPVSLPGATTSMIAGEINRADGLADLIVAIRGEGGPAVAVFEAPGGALSAAPDVLMLPAAAGPMALADLDGDAWIDLVIGAERDLLIVHGQDRQLAVDEEHRRELEPRVVERLEMPERVVGVNSVEMLGGGRNRPQVAVLLEGGRQRLLRRGIGSEAMWTPIEDLQASPALSSARITGLEQERITDSDASPIAVLPMRLNPDALADLVLLYDGETTPRVATSAVQATITVDSALDTAVASDGTCSLREALTNANANADTTGGDCAAGSAADMIGFSIGGGGATATIGLSSALPSIADPLTLDGTTQGCLVPPCVALDGSLAGPLVDGLTLTAGSTTVRGLAIHSFEGRGIVIQSAGNFVEGNFVGTDLAGLLDLGNGLDGIAIVAAANNTIGGTTPPARNVISGNGERGVSIVLLGSTGNLVQGNYIGTDVNGLVDLGNADDGILIQESSANTVGGTLAGAGNVISGNDSDGIYVLGIGATGNLIQGNLIGTDLTGLAALPNTDDGVQIQDAPGNTIGGTSPAARNVISGNGDDGVVLFSPNAAFNLVQGNFIGTDAQGLASLGNGSDGVLIQNGPNNVIGGVLVAARNVISGNDDDGVAISSGGTRNLVQGNYIGTDLDGSAGVPNGDDGVVVQSSPHNTIGGTAAGASNVVSANGGDGVLISSGSALNEVQGNLIGTDAAGTVDLGNGDDGVQLQDAYNNTIGGLLLADGNLISGNDDDGVVLTSAASGNRVQGNLIGCDGTGTSGLANADNGVELNNAPSNIIGGPTAGEGNVISGNGADGILLTSAGAANNAVEGNLIGTDVSGAVGLGNTLGGVLIQNAPNNSIGGASAGAGNVISGNGDEGVSVVSPGATGNVIEGNYIGTDVDGLLDLGNVSDGVAIRNAPSNTVGGVAVGARNVISGNDADGILIVEIGATGNRIEGNFIGTNVSGTQKLGNGDDGIQIQDASSNTIGGTTAGAGNIISGNGAEGVNVVFVLAGATDNAIQGNFIGLDVSGLVGLGNSANGVCISDAAGNSIGGTTPAESNVISDNGAAGVSIESSGATGNLVRGNLIGLVADGSLAQGNKGEGVLIEDAPLNTVGGVQAGARNVVSGNKQEGIAIVAAGASGNLIQGNLVGTDPTGLLALGNSNDGISIRNAPSNTVGGLTVEARNVISGNGSDGVAILFAGASGNQVQGNFIGTDINGTGALGNDGDGVQVQDAPANTIGGTAAGAGNVVSGNAAEGVKIFAPGATGNVVQGNLIGTDLLGANALGNGSDGVVVQAASGNTIGGVVPQARNVISANGDDGVALLAGATANLVQGNLIGPDSSDGLELPNGSNGVEILDAPANKIGGTTATEANVIRGNGGNGVLVFGTGGGAILRNSIVSNGKLGVALETDEVLPNDPGDLDLGGNRGQNYPIFTTSTSSALGTNIEGTFNSAADSTFRLEFFSGSECDPSGHGEGRFFLVTFDVTTDVFGNAGFAFTHPAVIPIGDYLTLTATSHVAGIPTHTSEFSPCSLVESTIDVKKFLSGNADEDGSGNVTLGDTLTYGFKITNVGLVTLDTLSVTDPLPGLGAIDCGGVTTLLPDAMVVCTATYIVTQADVDTGLLINTATTQALEPLGDPVSDEGAVAVCLAPVESPELIVGKTGTTSLVSWTSAAGATLFDVVRGSISTLQGTDGNFATATQACISDDQAGLSVADSDTPSAGEGFWYLVRRSDCTGGTYETGVSSQAGLRDSEIGASGSDCP